MTPRFPEEIDQADVDAMIGRFDHRLVRRAVAAYRRMIDRRDLRIEQLEAKNVELQAKLAGYATYTGLDIDTGEHHSAEDSDEPELPANYVPDAG